MVILLLYLWVCWLIRVGIDLRTGNDFGQALTQQQRDQCHWADSLQHNSSALKIKQQHIFLMLASMAYIIDKSRSARSHVHMLCVLPSCDAAAWLVWTGVVDGNTWQKLLH